MEEDYQQYESLPNIVTIYRGSNNKSDYKSISWTIDKKRAIWFYKKYESKGCVFEAKINKNDIKCFLDKSTCNEKEVVVDYKKIYDVKKLSSSEVNKEYDFSEYMNDNVNFDYAILATQNMIELLMHFKIIPTKELIEEIFKTYQMRGKYKSNYILNFVSGEKIKLYDLFKKLEK